MRNWTYAYALDNNKDSKVKGKYKVAPLPDASRAPARPASSAVTTA